MGAEHLYLAGDAVSSAVIQQGGEAMAKTNGKRGTPPLFELLQGNRFRRGDAGPQRPELRVVHSETEPDEDVADSADAVRLAYSEENPVNPGGKQTAIQFLGDRLHVSLTPLTAAIGVFVISLVVLGAIFVGQRRGEKAALLRAASMASLPGGAGEVDAVENVRQQPPASHLVESLLEGNAKAAPGPRELDRAQPKAAPAVKAQPPVELAAGPRQGWVRDYTYIVAQEFAAGRDEDARRAQEFLASRGFVSQVVKLDSGALQLITLEGYNHKDPAQKKKADEILKKQRAVGVEYFAAGGGYKLEGYYKTLKRDQW